MVGTYRDLPPDLQRPLEQMLAALNRERLAERLPVRRLPEAGVAQMVAGLLEQSFEHEHEHEHEHEAIGGEDEPAAEGADALAPGTPAPARARARARKRSVPAALVAALHLQTEGNPFFVEEVLQHLVEEGVITRRDGRWQVALPAEFRVPPSVQAAIGRRLERLAAASREALTLAAVIGLQFDFEVLLAASGVEEERLVGWVEEWLGARLVVEERGGREEIYQFQHALIREVLYGGISRPQQGRLHERVGLALEAVPRREEPLEELAHHFARARSESAREKGVEYCLRAGAKAHDLSADVATVQHIQAALRLLDALPEDEAHLKRRWQAVELLSYAHRMRLEWEPGRQALEEYRARAERAGCTWAIAIAHHGLALQINWEIEQGECRDIELARHHAETSLALCEREGLADLLLGVRTRLARLLTLEPGSDLPRAEALLRQGLASREELDPVLVQWTYGVLTRLYASQGRWDEVMATLRESSAAGSVPMYGVFALNQMEEALDAQRRQAEFVAYCDEARRLLAQSGAADPLAEWYLEPARPSGLFRQVAFQDDFEGPTLREEWQWCNPLQASTYSLAERAGCLTLRAAEGTDLIPSVGLNAPRLLLEVRGEFAIEARMESDWDERDQGSSGLLVWKDHRNFLRLEKFCMDAQYGNVGLHAVIQGWFRVVGRGLLRGSAFQLRLEREGERFTALCSTDGVHWLTCGQVAFPARDPLLVGIASLRGMVAHFDWVRVLT